MSWLKIDDAMLDHRKVRRAIKDAGLGTLGLHIAAMLNASKYLTDGHVEREFVEELLDDARVRGKARAEMVAALVERGLWTEDARGGWMIHDYLEHNPNRAEVLAKREADAERKRRGRLAQSKGRPDGVHADGARTDDGVQAESDGPVPSRPVPSPYKKGVGPIDAARDLPTDSDQNWLVIEGGEAA